MAKWAEAVGIFGFFAGITFWMVERVRSLLKIAYNWINIYYLKLSREMEYHADLVAISVSGNQAFKNALRKIEFSSFAFEYATSYLNALANKQKATKNLYKDHTFTISYLANHHQLSSKDGELQISDEDLEKNLIKSRVNIKDQWASHPTFKERENNIAKVEIVCDINQESAWKLFKDAAHLQVRVTEKLYSTGCFGDIYGREKVEIIRRFQANQADLETLGQISLKQIATKYFGFDGKKYKRKEASALIKRLKQEIRQEAKTIAALDKRSFQLNYQLAKPHGLEKDLTDFQLQFRVETHDP